MKNENPKNKAGNLRNSAENIVKKKSLKSNMNLSETEMLKLIYELEVHQVELELQNEELKLAQAAANSYAEKYHELYDFAPIGYLTLSQDGTISEINLFASQMLNKDRLHLKNSIMGFFISDDTKPAFNHFLRKIYTSGIKQTCEITLSIENKPRLVVRMTGIISNDPNLCLVTLLDITDQKRAEDELRKWATLFQPKVN
jgi:signal transduction histidine kinase